MIDIESIKVALKIQIRSWFQREILHSDNPPRVEECLKVLEQLGFVQQELEDARWQLVIAHANRMALKYNLHAEYLNGIHSVGVQGDERSFTPVIVLYGPFPGWDVLSELGTGIPNALPVNRVTYEFAIKKINLDEILTKEQLNLLRSTS